MKEYETTKSEMPMELTGEEGKGLQVMKKIEELRKEISRKKKEEAEDKKKEAGRS
jgi:hypothetical protein